MKHFFLLIVAAILSLHTFSQNWVLEWYKTGNKAFLSSQITSKANQGYLPVGIEVAPDPDGTVVSLYVLYIFDQSLGITAWYLDTYTSELSLESGINSMGRQDYVPKEIAYYDGTYYVLYLRFSNAATAWTIQNAVYSNQGLSGTISRYDAQGYVPFGYTLARGSLKLLFVKIPLNTLTGWTVEVYKGLYATRQGITAKQSEGWSPWALLVDGNEFIIMYLKNG